MFQESLKVVSRKIEGCFQEVLRVFPGSFKGVSRKFQGLFKKVSVLGVFQESFNGI